MSHELYANTINLLSITENFYQLKHAASQHPYTAAKTSVKCAKGTAAVQESSIERMYGNRAAIRAGVEPHPTGRPSSSRGNLSAATIDAFQLKLAQQEVWEALLRIKLALLGGTVAAPS